MRNAWESLRNSPVTTEIVCGISSIAIATREAESAWVERYGLSWVSLMVNVGRVTTSFFSASGAAAGAWAWARPAEPSRRAATEVARSNERVRLGFMGGLGSWCRTLAEIARAGPGGRARANASA